MRRFYAHYTFIYPDTFLYNQLVEQGSDARIVKYYPFENEIANTEFYSGLQVFLPYDLEVETARQQFISIQPLWAELFDDALIRRFRV